MGTAKADQLGRRESSILLHSLAVQAARERRRPHPFRAVERAAVESSIHMRNRDGYCTAPWRPASTLCSPRDQNCRQSCVATPPRPATRVSRGLRARSVLGVSFGAGGLQILRESWGEVCMLCFGPQKKGSKDGGKISEHYS